jgi:hypothetical protein
MLPTAPGRRGSLAVGGVAEALARGLLRGAAGDRKPIESGHLWAAVAT